MKICAAGVLLKDNKILLGKRASSREFYPNVWDAFGGHCKEGENIEQCLIRELKEELGITPIDFIPLGILQEQESQTYGKYEYHIYLIIKWAGKPANLSLKEHSEIGWFKIKEAIKLKLAHPEYPNLLNNIEDLMDIG